MKKILVLSLLIAGTTTVSALAADVELGKQKAAIACTGCHGNETSGGTFPALQLAGRNADRLVVKTNKYRTGKAFNPIMMMAAMKVSDPDIADIAAYYQSLGKPAFTPPYITIKGDDDGSVATVADPARQAAAY